MRIEVNGYRYVPFEDHRAALIGAYAWGVACNIGWAIGTLLYHWVIR